MFQVRLNIYSMVTFYIFSKYLYLPFTLGGDSGYNRVLFLQEGKLLIVYLQLPNMAFYIFIKASGAPSKATVPWCKSAML